MKSPEVRSWKPAEIIQLPTSTGIPPDNPYGLVESQILGVLPMEDEKGTEYLMNDGLWNIVRSSDMRHLDLLAQLKDSGEEARIFGPIFLNPARRQLFIDTLIIESVQNPSQRWALPDREFLNPRYASFEREYHRHIIERSTR